MKHNKIDRALFSDIKEKFAELKTINRLANYYAVDSVTIKKILKEFDIDPFYYKKQESQTKEAAVQYCQEGHTTVECCKKFNLTYYKLAKILHKHNLNKLNTETNITCKICKTFFDNKYIFSKHIFHKHNLSSKQYYDTFCKKPAEGNCEICNKKTQYINFIAGYNPYCSRSCGAKAFRQRLKNNPVKHAQYIKKLSSNSKRMHANMSAEEKMRRSQHLSEVNKKANSILTPEERKHKRGWMNKLTEQEKKDFIRNVMTKTGCHLWWKTSTDEEKQKVFKKRADTKNQNSSNNLIYNEFLKYRNSVTVLTKRTYKKFKSEINPHNLQRRRGSSGYHLDHKYSVFEGFINNVAPEIISNKHNLQMLSGSENISKGITCSITLECLVNLYEKESKI